MKRETLKSMAPTLVMLVKLKFEVFSKHGTQIKYSILLRYDNCV